MKKAFFLLVPLVGLCACQPPLTWDQKLSIYRSKCMDFGYQPGTPDFANCVEEQDTQARDEEERALDRQAAQNREWQRQNADRRRFDEKMRYKRNKERKKRDQNNLIIFP